MTYLYSTHWLVCWVCTHTHTKKAAVCQNLISFFPLFIHTILSKRSITSPNFSDWSWLPFSKLLLIVIYYPFSIVNHLKTVDPPKFYILQVEKRIEFVCLIFNITKIVSSIHIFGGDSSQNSIHFNRLLNPALKFSSSK